MEILNTSAISISCVSSAIAVPWLLLLSHTTVRWTSIFSHRSISTQSSWTFFISDKCCVLYIISDIGHIALNTFLLDLISSERFDECTFPSTWFSSRRFSVTMGASKFTSNYWFTSWTFWCHCNYIPVSQSSMQFLLPAGWPHKLCSGVSHHKLVCSQCLACFNTIVVLISGALVRAD